MPHTPPMPAPSPKSASRPGPRERILEAADRLFFARGFTATGVNEIIEEAGVAKASFYLHFPSKDDLIAAYLGRQCAGSLGAYDEAIARRKTPLSRLIAVFDFAQEFLESTDHRGCPLHNAAPELEGKAREIVRDGKVATREMIRGLCRDLGDADAGDEVFLLLEGAFVQASLTREPWPFQAARRAVKRRFATGL